MLQPPFSNLLASSFLLWINNIFINNSQAYTTTSSLFYPMNNVSGYGGQTIQGLYTYQAPFSQFVCDNSINGATVMTGVYLGNTLISKNISGLVDIDYLNGRLYFNQQIPSNIPISGTYSYKDFSIQLTNLPEEKLLYQTQFVQRPKVAQSPTGMPLNSVSYPCLLIKTMPDENKPFAFGGEDETNITMGVMIFADSQYLLDGAVSYLIDLGREYVPFLKQNEFPYNVYGGFIQTGIYNYASATNSKIPNGSGILIKKVVASRFDQTDIKNINPNVYFATVDFELSCYRFPRFNNHGLTKN